MLKSDWTMCLKLVKHSGLNSQPHHSIRYVGVIQSHFLIKHLYLNGMWLGADLKICGLEMVLVLTHILI